MTEPTIPLSEYDARRKKVLSALKQSIAVVYAGEPPDALHDDFRPHPNFEYLTGITGETGAALLLDPTHPVESRRNTTPSSLMRFSISALTTEPCSMRWRAARLCATPICS